VTYRVLKCASLPGHFEFREANLNCPTIPFPRIEGTKNKIKMRSFQLGIEQRSILVESENRKEVRSILKQKSTRNSVSELDEKKSSFAEILAGKPKLVRSVLHGEN